MVYMHSYPSCKLVATHKISLPINVHVHIIPLHVRTHTHTHTHAVILLGESEI